jgi:PHP family Zn ribbon phosphoesterase
VGVREEYFKLCDAFGGEFSVLLDVPIEEVWKLTSPRVAEGLRRVREGRVSIAPGYDGVFGEISIFKDGEEIRESIAAEPAQTTLF